MKKLIMAAIGVLALGVMPAMAQSEDAPARINKVSAFYDLTTLYPKGADNVYFNGFGVGYNIDFRVSRTMPLYVGTALTRASCSTRRRFLTTRSTTLWTSRPTTRSSTSTCPSM